MEKAWLKSPRNSTKDKQVEELINDILGGNVPLNHYRQTLPGVFVKTVKLQIKEGEFSSGEQQGGSDMKLFEPE